MEVELKIIGKRERPLQSSTTKEPFHFRRRSNHSVKKKKFKHKRKVKKGDFILRYVNKKLYVVVGYDTGNRVFIKPVLEMDSDKFSVTEHDLDYKFN